jgi:hypothetical protein
MAEQNYEKARIETKRRKTKTSQVATIRLIDVRYCHPYATRSATVANRVVANALVLDRVLNVHTESYSPLISSIFTVCA